MGGQRTAKYQGGHVRVWAWLFALALVLGAAGCRSRAIGGSLAAPQPPVADAGGDQSVIAGNATSFDGRGSLDPDGTIVSYAWDFGDGDNGTGQTATHVYATTGSYTVTLTVTDDDGLTGRATVTVTVVVVELPEGGRLVWNSNRGPMGIHAIYTMKVGKGEEAVQALTDEDEYAEWYPRWSPDGSKIVYTRATTPREMRPQNAAKPDNSEIWLMDRDGSNKRKLAAQGFMAVWTRDGSAVVYKGPNYDVVRHDIQTDKITVLAQRDQGMFTGYRWEWDTVELGKGDRYLMIGLRFFGAESPVVFDLEGGKEIGPLGYGCTGCWAPGGNFIVHTTGPADGHYLAINDFDPVTGTLGEERKLIDLADFAQEYKVRVANDDQWLVWSAWRSGAHDTASSDVWLWKKGEPAATAVKLTSHLATDIWPDLYLNQPPSATASASPDRGAAPLVVNFTGAGSDPDGAIVGYSWDFGDGSPVSAEQNPTHTYNDSGSYTAVLTVTDDEGATAQGGVMITVE